jgi:hypothetical protein
VIHRVYTIASRLYRAVKPVRDRLYKAFIRTFPCAGCGQSWWIDAAHTGPHALSRKASDLLCIPLCRGCHESYDAAPADFAWTHNQMDVEALTLFFQHVYRERYPERQKPEATPVVKEAA